MIRTGYSLVELSTGNIVWGGSLPANIELRDANGGVIIRADFDKPGLVVPDSENPTHKMVPRMEIEPASPDQQRGGETITFDGEQVICDPHWFDPPPPEPQAEPQPEPAPEQEP